MQDTIYPQIEISAKANRDPKFPPACPVCGAVADGRNVNWSFEYSCGGSYEPKPQIQNHTRVWWGRCQK